MHCYCHYTGAGCLSKLLKVNNSLQELDMYRNDIGDDGISLVVDGLQCNSTLIKLNVGLCRLSVKGTVDSHIASVYNSKLLGHSSSCPIKFSVFN